MPYQVYQDTERKSKLLPNGEYFAEIMSCVDKPSAKGDPMWTLRLRFPEENVTVFDYIVFIEEMAWKAASLMAAVGIPYDGNATPSDMEGRTLTVKLRQQKDKRDGTMRNAVDTYVPRKAGEGAVSASENPSELPF